MSIEQLSQALDERILELQAEFGPASRRVLDRIILDQLHLIRDRADGFEAGPALLIRLQHAEELIEEVPVTALDQLPAKWARFQENLPTESPGVGLIYFESALTSNTVKATGWICDWHGRRDLLVTNAHVANCVSLILRRSPRDFSESQLERIGVCFDGAIGDQSVFLPTDRVFVDNCYDLAVFRIRGAVPNGLTALKLAEPDQLPAPEDLVVGLGYPGMLGGLDEEEWEVYKRNFPFSHNTRVASPGRVTRVRGWQVLHTCTLAPGSSGSPLLNVRGQVVGTHFYGQRRVTNYAVSAIEIAAMLNLIDF